MVGHKRGLDDKSSFQKSKKKKFSEGALQGKQATQKAVEFPRGGGTSFTPLEVKAIRAEGVDEANVKLISVNFLIRHILKNNVDSIKNPTLKECLNYKRIVPGMKIFGQIMFIHPLALIVSLPNRIVAHVPVTQVTSQLTERLESTPANTVQPGEYSHIENGWNSSFHIPELAHLFYPGQYVRAIVIATHAAGSADVCGLGKVRNDAIRASRRIELSLIPERVNAGVQKSDLTTGFTMSAALRSVEDHGYIFDLGISDTSGFLSFKDYRKAHVNTNHFVVGSLVEVCVTEMSTDGRNCTLSVDPELLASASLSEVTHVSSILPGSMVQSLIISAKPAGLNLKLLHFFNGVVNEFHLPAGEMEEYKVGRKVKARVLYSVHSSPYPTFAVSLADHIIGLKKKEEVESYPIGTVLEAVRVNKLEGEQGLIVEVQPGVEGFVHISQISDDHVLSLSATGPWKLNTIHRGRVTGLHPLDGILQLSLRRSVLEQKFLEAGEILVGEVLRGTIKQMTKSALFISISANVDGVVWPNHYADIAIKHPTLRFKLGVSIKCRVLTIDSEQRRIVLTAKKTLVESTLPILSSYDDDNIGLVTDAAVSKILDKAIQVEFYNNVKAIIPLQEVGQVTGKLADEFSVGKVVKVRIISIDAKNQRMVASIRQVTLNVQSVAATITGVEIGSTVEGIVTEIHTRNIALSLQPTQAPALISLRNLANHYGTTSAKLEMSLKVGDRVDRLVVVSRNLEKDFVLVVGNLRGRAVIKKGAVSMDTIEIGQVVGGRVTRHCHSGAHVKISTRISGSLHPTDVSDNYDAGISFLPVDSILKAVVIGIDKSNNHATLSTRPSRFLPVKTGLVTDREIKAFAELKTGDTVRGFVKSVSEHGLFVMLGRGIDARVQIKELFNTFVKDWKSRFTANQVVKGSILSVDVLTKKVEMTFRSRDLTRDGTDSFTFADLHQGQKVTGRVKRIELYGLFIEIDGSTLSGLCHKSELSDNKDADVTVSLGNFREGDPVKALILSIDQENRRISFGLKPSYFVGDDHEADMDIVLQDRGEGTMSVVCDNGELLAIREVVDSDHSSRKDVSSGEQQNDGEDMLADIATPLTQLYTASLLQNSAHLLNLEAFQWFDLGTLSESSSKSSEDGDLGQNKKTFRKGVKDGDLTADIHFQPPEAIADFEKLLLGSPNSSFLWIRYISFQLQLSELDRARELGRRAIQTINFREEQEKLNVWIAMLNLENTYGTNDTLETTFKDALRYNDAKTLHLRLAAIFEQSEKHEKAEEQYIRACRKFSHSSKVWTLFAEYYLRCGKLEQARRLLSASLHSLEINKHLKTISRFAQMEYKLGDPERGKTIFEGAVDSHPKRWDLWSVYIDMEAGQCAMQNLRDIFNRVFAINMTGHNAKYFFKKWLDLEQKFGHGEGAIAVKVKAMEWVQKVTNINS
ncbi:hypothetical protein SERLADRAFT_444441 [Serpula lacrymans var. lacrymans S7.9]|uniref:S1 motif domain-containing protein n=1 Tax=Serpula lacrymans var. lacrymans (strain S7.9) TaxID=578457 RepID=F8NF20_SERL9|nr:uncharacterized protein SERLADRAFT_444441 [Serpula lacrymans var. lacrymans S7.9]EGO30779.1 hypothetical protein SERLADRAFT_444441 [Serpula lacrymans var. lacrymans S7.9]